METYLDQIRRMENQILSDYPAPVALRALMTYLSSMQKLRIYSDLIKTNCCYDLFHMEPMSRKELMKDDDKT